MSDIDIDGVRLHAEVKGQGEPIVLVHGSWCDARSWALIDDTLAASFRVITYDRRGHSRSDRPEGAVTRRRHEDDLAAIIAQLAGGPAFVVGNSYGGSIALGMAARRPDLVTGVTVHEPPLLEVATAESDRELFAGASGALGGVIEQIVSGDHVGASQRFMDDIAIGPGAWDLMTADERAIHVGNAPAFVADMADPGFGALDAAGVDAIAGPFVVSQGGEAPPFLRRLADLVAAAVPSARSVTIPGAGHDPHESHPAEYVALVAATAREASAALAA